MAYQCVLLALIFVTTLSLANGLIINGTLITLANIGGSLCCSASGNQKGNSPGIAGATLAVICNHGATNIGQALTNVNGVFTIVIDTLHGIGVTLDISLCVVREIRPVNGCNLLPETGNLEAILSLVSVSVAGIARFGIGLFKHVV